MFAPLITTHGPLDQDLNNTLQGPSSSHWLGTDDLGRDTWSRLVYGARTDLRVAFLAVLLPVHHRHADRPARRLLRRLVRHADELAREHRRRVPVLRADHRARLRARLRARATSTSRSRSSAGSRTRGSCAARCWSRSAASTCSPPRRAGSRTPASSFRHLLPNVITQAIVFSMSDIVLDILAIVTLGYLGLGVQPPTPDWGTMIADGQTYLTTHWELSTVPGIAVVITALGLVAARRRARRPAEARVSEPLLRGRGPRRRDPARRAACCARSTAPPSTSLPGGGARDRRRVGLGQDDGAARAARAAAPHGADHRRHRSSSTGEDLVQAGEDRRRELRGTIDRDDLPGADDRAEPGDARRRPDRGGAARAARRRAGAARTSGRSS